MNRFLKRAAIILILLSLPFVLELIISSYDAARNPWTRPGSIVADGGSVSEGVNKRIFKEIRFRAKGLRLDFVASDVPQSDADAIISGITGTLTVIKNGQAFISYDFKLSPQIRKDADKVNFVDEGEAGGSLGLAEISMFECHIVPAGDGDTLEAAHLAAYEFEIGEAVELDLDFKGEIPPSSKLRFAYSKSPDSVLHGTFLAGIGRHFRSSN